MEKFKSFLLNRRITNEKKADFYILWVSLFYDFCKKHPEDRIKTEDIERYLKHLSKSREEWQVKQASEAIRLFDFFRNREKSGTPEKRQDRKADWKAIADEMRNIIRLKHLSIRTEQAYLHWLRKFYYYLNGLDPYSLESSHVKNFMTHLAVDQHVAVSTQNQAFNAILFLFRHILNKSIDDIGEAIRAKRKRRIPVVMTRRELDNLFNQLSGTDLLMAKLIYGCGLRLGECLHLRIKDIDFERGTIIVRMGKGDKDRETVFPEGLKKELGRHLEEVNSTYQKDRKNDVPGVQLPNALDRKYPNAGKEWAWFWVFPSDRLSVDPITSVYP